MLMRRWEQARQGDGHLVLIVGEPGLGQVAAQWGITRAWAMDRRMCSLDQEVGS